MFQLKTNTTWDFERGVCACVVFTYQTPSNTDEQTNGVGRGQPMEMVTNVKRRENDNV